MTPTRRLPHLVLAALLSASCDGSSPECTFSSDCAVGRYCTDTGTCRADCASDADCEATLGTGAVCNSFGMCIAAPDAGPGEDAGTPPDAGGRDAGVDAGTDAGIDAGVPDEVCTPSTTGSVPTDEDLDGAVDEGCGWHFGRVHAVPVLQVDDGATMVVGVSADGLRVYLTGGAASVGASAPPTCFGGAGAVGDRCYQSCGGAGGNRCDAASCVGYGTLDSYDCPVCCNVDVPINPHRVDRGLYVARRPSLAEPFGRPEAVAGLEPNNAISSATLSADELEIIFDEDLRAGSAPELMRAVRPSLAAPFGPAMPLSSVHEAGAREIAPRLSRDGRELWFTRVGASRSGFRATRASAAEPFSGVAPVVLPPGAFEHAGFTPSADGRTVFFVRNNGAEWRLYRASRADTSTLALDTLVELTELGAGGDVYVPYVDEAHREVWLASSRAWSAGALGVFRAQLCRDGPCDEPLIACDTGVRSPDGFHCYFDTGDAAFRIDAVTTCAALASRLLTLHSPAEDALVSTAFRPNGVWTGASDESAEGLWRWDWPGRVGTEEPFTYVTWGQASGHAREPIGGQGHDCAHLVTADWPTLGLNDLDCVLHMARAVCEDEVWPTW